MILPAWPDHTSKKSERCSSTGQILAVHKNVQLHRKKAKELGLQNSEYITFPNWAAQRPKQQLCRRPQEAQPMSDLCQAILQACRAAGSSEEATVLCLVKTSQWAYAQCVALADLVPWQAYQRVLFHIAVPGLEIAVQGWVDSYAVGSNRQLLVDFAPQLLHVLDHLKQHGELHPWHQSPCLRAWDQLGNWQILQLTEHYAYTTAAVGGQGALASPLSYQQTDRYAHTAADQDQAESDADSGTDVAWHNCASPLDAPFEWAASLSKSPDMHAPQCADVAISNAEEGFQPLWLDGNSLTGTSHVTAPLQQQHGTIHSMEANTDSSVGAKAAFPESCFAGPTSQPFTLQPVGGKPIVDVVIDAVGNPAEPYMLRVVNSAAESTMDLHASVLVKVAPESIPEVKAFMQHVSAIMSRAQNGDDSAILQMHQMCKVCKDEGILCNQLPQSLAQPHANSAATIEGTSLLVCLLACATVGVLLWINARCVSCMWCVQAMPHMVCIHLVNWPGAKPPWSLSTSSRSQVAVSLACETGRSGLDAVSLILCLIPYAGI
ncbi:TPA: hypothetical protein ACH3X2_011841 [Trebouxia sp. C0005]